jgi:hypothetical protein
MIIILYSRHYNKMSELSRNGDPEVSPIFDSPMYNPLSNPSIRQEGS